VLSRVTLGADVAVTSVLLDAAKRRYPEAEIFFVGPRKNYELFEADPRIAHMPAPYARSGALRERLAASAALWIDDGVVLDSDSRLSQLGVLSVCEEANYFWFESRSYGGAGLGRLPELAREWAKEILHIERARPYVAPLPRTGPLVDITVSLGVGENPSKRVDDDFEKQLLILLASTGASILVDKGGSEDEHKRVEAALEPGMLTHDGAFAPFAACIATSKLFVGYDSAAGHVASACEIPSISIASGFASDRAAARWRPNGIVLASDAKNILGGVKHVLASLRPKLQSS
jgi:ADP-heptose:LPS heptosyltransferase